VTPQLTDDQRRAVETEGVDLCVVAGAGTGKTRVLTERIVHRVVDRGVDLRRILAITFTEKAAAEMKSRLAETLERAGRASAREEVEAAAISTIHAFCARLLREHAVEAGVDPQFRVLDEVASEARRREALDAFVADLAARDPSEFGALAELPGDDPAETLLDVWRAARESGRDLAQFLETPAGLPDRADLLATIRDDVAQAVDAARGVAKASQEKVRAAETALRGFPADDAAPEALGAAVAKLRGSFSLQVAAGVKPWLENLRSGCDALLETLAEESLAPLRARLARAVVRLEELYSAAKGDGRELDFVDLERRAVELLETRDDVRATVRARWGEVLVDEFQDVNPLQARLVDGVRAERRLFVVGDPKQSIYGFRGSDVDVFVARREEIVASDARGEVTLAASYRSRPEVIEVVNGLFKDGFPLGAPLVAARKFAPCAAPCAELFVVDADDAEDGRGAEAAWIADRIVALVAGPDAPSVAAPTDDDPLATRRPTFGDVAVLLRTMSNVKLVERALTSRDVPYVVLKGRGFFEAREVVDLANLLEVVDNPRDDLVLASVLRSLACGLSDDALFALCRARAEGRALADVIEDFDAAELPSRERAAFARFVEAFRGLRRIRAFAPVTVLVDRALAATRLETLALARPNGRQRAANLRKVRSLARAADSDGGDLRAFLRGVRDLREREVRETEAPVSGGAAGAVSLLTVHAAKGLEFPIVFVPDLGRGEGGERSSIASNARDGVGLKTADAAGPFEDVKPWAFRRVEESNAERARAEEDRLLYVAVTRAEEHLVLSTSLTPRTKERPWWDRVASALGVTGPTSEASTVAPGVLVHASTRADAVESAGTRTLFHRVAHEIARGRVSTGDAAPEDVAAAERLVAEASRVVPPHEGTLFSATVSGIVAFARCPQEFRLRHVVGAPESFDGAVSVDEDASDVERPGDDDEWGVPLSARALGRAVHLALERLVPSLDGDVAAAAREALASESGGAPPSPEDVERVASWIRGFAESDIGRELRTLPRDDVRREQALLFPVAPGAKTIVRGQMDLVYRGARGWTVVDYKAGRTDALKDDYVLQMRLYAVGLEAITGEPPARLVLFSLPDARAIDVPCSADDVERLRDGLVVEFLDRTKRADYAPRAKPPCFSCAYRRRCAFSSAGDAS
jgi:ATP-dependent helicase/nuclease subunit A